LQRGRALQSAFASVPPFGLRQCASVPCEGYRDTEAAANSFCNLLRNWPKAVFLKRALAEDLSVPFGHDSGLEPYLEQLALMKHEENDNVEDDRSPQVTGLPTPSGCRCFHPTTVGPPTRAFFAVAS